MSEKILILIVNNKSSKLYHISVSLSIVPKLGTMSKILVRKRLSDHFLHTGRNSNLRHGMVVLSVRYYPPKKLKLLRKRHRLMISYDYRRRQLIPATSMKKINWQMKKLILLNVNCVSIYLKWYNKCWWINLKVNCPRQKQFFALVAWACQTTI